MKIAIKEFFLNFSFLNSYFIQFVSTTFRILKIVKNSNIFEKWLFSLKIQKTIVILRIGMLVNMNRVTKIKRVVNGGIS